MYTHMYVIVSACWILLYVFGSVSHLWHFYFAVEEHLCQVVIHVTLYSFYHCGHVEFNHASPLITICAP